MLTPRPTRHRTKNVAANLTVDGHFAICPVEDVSRSGLFLRTDLHLPVGLSTVLDLAQPGLKKRIRLPGTVARVGSNGRLGIGIKFDRFDHETQQQFDQFGRQFEGAEGTVTIAAATAALTGQAPPAEGPASTLAPQTPALSLEQTQLEVDVKGLRQHLAERDATLAEKEREVATLREVLERTMVALKVARRRLGYTDL